MRGKKLLATLALSAVLFAGCGLKSGEVIIKVNDKTITQGQFDQEFDKQAGSGIAKALGIDVKDDKNSFLYLLIKDRVINELIVKTLLDEEIAKRGITVTSKDVDDAVKEIIDKVGSKEQLNALLKEHGMSNAEFKKDLKEEVKMKRLAEQLGSAKVSDAEAKKFYNDNINKFKHPDKVRASHILIAANPEEIAAKIKADPKNKNLDDADDSVTYEGETFNGNTKFEGLFRSKLNVKSGNGAVFYTTDGVKWDLSGTEGAWTKRVVSGPQNAGIGEILIDVNGDDGPNARENASSADEFDQYVIEVMATGKMKVADEDAKAIEYVTINTSIRDSL